MRWLIILLLTSCTRVPLEVRSHYLTPEYLAAFKVNTPDPLIPCFFGQEIVIHYDTALPADLILQVRYCDRSVRRFVKHLWRACGYAQFRVMEGEGILSYKVELVCEGRIVACKKHHLWADLIESF